MALRTKPKHDSLAWAFVIGAAVAGGTWFVMERYIDPRQRPGFPPPPPLNWASIILALIFVGAMSVGATWLLNRRMPFR